MSFFRKTSYLGATILGATIGGVGIPLVMSLSPLSVSASDGNAAGKHPGVQACKDDTIPLVARDDLELKFVQIFFRHGARTPIGTGCIPNVEEGVWDKDTIFQGAADLCIDYKVCALDGEPQPEWEIENYYRKVPLKGGAFKGQLTAVGMKQANDLGKKLRGHYMEKLGFLPNEFSPQLVYTRSTNINRTLQSLGCLMGVYMATLSHPKSSSRFQLCQGCINFKGNHPVFSAAPVQFYTDEGLGEVLYPNRQRCNQLSDFYSSVLKGMFSVPGIGRGTDQIAPLLDASEEQKKKLDFVSMRDDISARLEHKMEVPDHLMPVIDLIEKHAVALMRFLIEGGNEPGKNVIKFSAGPTMHYICETLGAAKRKEIPYKLHLNSCHDTTLMTLLLALEAFDDVWPPLTASVIFELYEDKAGNSYVRTLYQNKELRIRQSEETLLTLEKFKELLAPISYTDQDYADACKVAS